MRKVRSGPERTACRLSIESVRLRRRWRGGRRSLDWRPISRSMLGRGCLIAFLARGLVFSWRVRTVRTREFERARVRRGMQSGTRIYYDVFGTAGGKDIEVASSLGRKRQAEWLADVITDATRGTT